MAQVNVKAADVVLANPAPLGLMGFGMTTVLLNLSNAGYFATDSVSTRHGNLLRRNSTDYRRVLRIQEGQYFRNDSISLVRTILGKLRSTPRDSANQLGKGIRVQYNFCGGVLGSVGNFHTTHVR